MKRIVIIVALTVAINLIACNDKKTNEETTNKEAETKEIVVPEVPENAEEKRVTIKATVLSVEHGKDGVTAKAVDDDGVEYSIIISIPNLKEPDMYREVKKDDIITVSGTLWEMEGQNYFKAVTLMI
ncbi:hypothetical protein V1389_07645 [Flavobacterium rakeshii]|uniref:hypothetical protein n=1 Tax=Flavobacterium rakeshii TaxID=1038845 RepID=UPI002E7C5194|nr:hypothetical protein [Flavobacterium rakeshii]MEE1898203.1 hypothetical protein [Flavobacterium rakeshii]